LVDAASLVFADAAEGDFVLGLRFAGLLPEETPPPDFLGLTGAVAVGSADLLAERVLGFEALALLAGVLAGMCVIS